MLSMLEDCLGIWTKIGWGGQAGLTAVGGSRQEENNPTQKEIVCLGPRPKQRSLFIGGTTKTGSKFLKICMLNL